jgi:hypothetical protein
VRMEFLVRTEIYIAYEKADDAAQLCSLVGAN